MVLFHLNMVVYCVTIIQFSSKIVRPTETSQTTYICKASLYFKNIVWSSGLQCKQTNDQSLTADQTL
jgi:hypothetical protein